MQRELRGPRLIPGGGADTFVEFAAPLHTSAPTLVHLTRIPEMPWGIELDELTERGMLLRVRWRDAAQGAGAEGQQEPLRLRYVAGLASGYSVVPPSDLRERRVVVHFRMRLPGRPPFAFVESSLTDAGGGTGSGELVVRRPDVCGFVLGLRLGGGQAADRASVPVWYEAVSPELIVTAERLQTLAPLDEVPDEVEQDMRGQAEHLPESLLIPSDMRHRHHRSTMSLKVSAMSTTCFARRWVWGEASTKMKLMTQI